MTEVEEDWHRQRDLLLKTNSFLSSDAHAMMCSVTKNAAAEKNAAGASSQEQ